LNIQRQSGRSPSLPAKVFPILSLGMVAISAGSILVRFSQEAPSLAIAFYRMLWATVILFPFFWHRREPLSHYLRWEYAAAGIALALHFAFWIHSLRFTSVAVSVLLVNTSPVLVALLSFFFFRERLTRRGILGLASSVIGASVLFWNDLEDLGDWRGPVYAGLGALAVGCYLISGRSLRRNTDLINYVFPTYACAAAVLGLAVLTTGTPWRGFSWETHGFLLLLGLVPQVLGHTSYNWALGFLSATVVSTLILVEPILATLFAWWILDETVSGMILIGGVLVGTGIFLISHRGIASQKEV